MLAALGALLATAAVLYGVLAWAIPAVYGRESGAPAGVGAMAGVVTFSLVLSVLPVGVLGRLGVMPTVYAYFLGAAARFVICIAGGFLLVKAQGLPAAPVMLTLAIMYVPLLFIESALVGRYLWKKDSLGKQGPGVPTGSTLSGPAPTDPRKGALT